MYIHIHIFILYSFLFIVEFIFTCLYWYAHKNWPPPFGSFMIAHPCSPNNQSTLWWRMHLTNGSDRTRNPSRGRRIPVDCLGSGIPGTKSQGKGPTWPQSSPVRQWQKAHTKTPSNCETSVAKIQGTTFSFGLDGHASCIKLLDWKTNAKGLDSGIWKQFPLPSCRVAVGPIFWARRNETGPRNCGLLNHPKTTGSSSLQAGNLLRGVGARCGVPISPKFWPSKSTSWGWGQKSWSSYGDFGGSDFPILNHLSRFSVMLVSSLFLVALQVRDDRKLITWTAQRPMQADWNFKN